MGMTSKIVTQLQSALTSALDLQTVSTTLDKITSTSLSDGTGQNQANMHFSDTRSLAGSGTENLDLAGGLTNAFGVAITFAKIKAIYVKCAAANDGAIEFGEGIANAFVGPFQASSVGVAVAPGGELLLTAPKDGWTVTAGTGDLLKAQNLGSATNSYDIVLIGTV